MAKKMVVDGAKVMLSSRKSANVERAVEQLRSECEGVSVEGVVCHVGNDDHRKNLIKEVSSLWLLASFLAIMVDHFPLFW